MRQAVAMSVANQAKENMGFDITVKVYVLMIL